MVRDRSGNDPPSSMAAQGAPFRPSLFWSFIAAGFECSSHCRRDGRRLDLIVATGHDRYVDRDYGLAREHGMRTARDGLRWHLIDRSGRYDWSSFLPMLRAALAQDMQVVWDLCHYGYPDGLDIFRPEFVDRFARFVAAAARIVREETDQVPFYCPINEISYWAWVGGDEARFYPAVRGRGGELKRQLVRASIAAIEAVRDVDPRVRILHAEPAIRIIADPATPKAVGMAQQEHEAQFEAWDMLTGKVAPELGGRPDHLDIAGLNFYSDNQWRVNGGTIPLGHHKYEPLQDILAYIHARYGRPLYLAETGAERSARAAWLHYVGSEVRAALDRGLPVEGICLYPILDYPCWENDRPCECGLFSNPDEAGRRTPCESLAEELSHQQARFAERNRPQPRRANLGLAV
jgi:beta-glucosidase/6-phospho-beta-glucosidase/beta-galactosidase